MVTLLKKAVLVGLGAAEQGCERLDELLRKGEASQSALAQRIKALFEQGEQVEAEIRQKINDLAKRLCSCIPTKADIERLEKELADIEAQVRGLKGGG